MKAAGQQGREAHRPRQRVELLPEPIDHARHVERQHEPDRNHVAPTVAVVGDKLKRPASIRRPLTDEDLLTDELISVVLGRIAVLRRSA